MHRPSRLAAPCAAACALLSFGSACVAQVPNTATLGAPFQPAPGHSAPAAYLPPQPSVVVNSSPGYGYGYAPYYVGGTGAALQGLASYTQASGQYWQSIEQARITREQSRQASIDTARKQLQWELEYEKYRPTAPKMRRAEKRTDLEWALLGPPQTEIWSGRTLNVLLKASLDFPPGVRGPNISLPERTLNALNLTDNTTRGNLALAKDDGRIAWPEALQEEAFDGPRDAFAKDFNTAIKAVNSGQDPGVRALRELRKNLKVMDSTLDSQVATLPPGRYIEARRLINQLQNTIKGLSDPRLCKGCNASWKKNVHTVAALVEHCKSNGLQFGPAAAPGDEAQYTAAYYAMRNYYRGLSYQMTAR
jgi:hypothetical protein